MKPSRRGTYAVADPHSKFLITQQPPPPSPYSNCPQYHAVFEKFWPNNSLTFPLWNVSEVPLDAPVPATIILHWALSCLWFLFIRLKFFSDQTLSTVTTCNLRVDPGFPLKGRQPSSRGGGSTYNFIKISEKTAPPPWIRHCIQFVILSLSDTITAMLEVQITLTWIFRTIITTRSWFWDNPRPSISKVKTLSLIW